MKNPGLPLVFHLTRILSLTTVFATMQVVGISLSAQEETRDTGDIWLSKTEINVDHLSNGALYRLGLVQPPKPAETTTHSAAQIHPKTAEKIPLIESISTDARVGPNMRLGDDPTALPDDNPHQAEPHIIRSASDPDLILGTFQESRLTDGGAVNCGYALSQDGGLSWTRSLIPGLSQVSGGDYYRATDPVAGIDHNNVLYLNTLVARDAFFNTANIVVSRSTNRGQTWSDPLVVYTGTDVEFPDKNWMAVNNFPETSTAGRIVVTWTNFTNNFYWHNIKTTYSDNQGQAWSTPIDITPENSRNQGTQPIFFHDGTLGIVYVELFSATIVRPQRLLLKYQYSSDGGISFGNEIPISDSYVDLYSDIKLRSGKFLPSATTDRSTDSIYMVFMENYGDEDSKIPRIMFTKSTNKGTSWSTPIPISDNPENFTYASKESVVNPAISVSPDGRHLVVIFYDKRHAPDNFPSNFVDLYMVQSFDSGNTWSTGIRLSTESSDVTLAQQSGTLYMLGDYQAVAWPEAPYIPAVPIWVDTRFGNADPFAVRVAPGAVANSFQNYLALNLSYSEIIDPDPGVAVWDFDKDGLGSLQEWAHGTTLREPDIQQVFGPFESGQNISIRYNHAADIDNTHFEWDYSEDLSSWTPVLPTAWGTPVSLGNGQIQETVEFSLTASETGFLRLVIVE